MRELRLSATSNSDFQACQRRYQLAYLFDLTQDRDKDSLRMGGNWHTCHEVLELQPGSKCPECLRHEELRPGCYICQGAGYVPADTIDCVTRYLDHAYAVVPDNKTADEWELERTILLYSLSGWRWKYAEDERRWEVIGSEIKFELPVYSPASGRRIPKVLFVGKIDRLVRDRNTGLVYVWERKTTSKSLGDAGYWQGLTQGDQVSGYVYAVRALQHMGELKRYGITPDSAPVNGAFCDVWHKPDISPKRVSKSDLKTLAETGTYCGTELKDFPPFFTETKSTPSGVELTNCDVVVETPEMFGARLLQDIGERPDHYFAQREVSRTDQELEQFQVRLWRIAKQIRTVEKGDLWLKNLASCQASYKCEFCELCRSGIEVGPDDTPQGYVKRHAPQEVSLG